jgi:uncharacterized protein (TIGR03437 family)
VFTVNGSSLAAAIAVQVAANGTQTSQAAFTLNSAGSFSANAIGMGSDQVYLTLFGTGLAAAGTQGVSATVAGVSAPVLYAGPQGSFTGLDQVNILLPASLTGKGNVNLQITAAGIAANPVQITVQ